MTCHLGICRSEGGKGAREFSRERAREKRKKKKKSQTETASLFALLAPLPLPLHTPPNSSRPLTLWHQQGDDLSLLFLFSFAQPQTSFFSLSVLSLAPLLCKSDGGPHFSLGTFWPDDYLSGRIFTNNFRKHVFGHLRLESSLLLDFFSHPAFLFPFNLLNFTFPKRHS